MNISYSEQNHQDLQLFIIQLFKCKNGRPHFGNGKTNSSNFKVIIFSQKHIAKIRLPMLNAANYF